MRATFKWRSLLPSMASTTCCQKPPALSTISLKSLISYSFSSSDVIIEVGRGALTPRPSVSSCTALLLATELRLQQKYAPLMTTLLNLRAETLLAKRMSSSTKLKPPVSGSRKKHQIVHKIFVHIQKNADLAPIFQALGETKRGLTCPVMMPDTTYTARPRAMNCGLNRELGSSSAIE